MKASKKKTTASRGQDGGTHCPQPNESTGGATVETDTAAKRPKLAPDFWPVVPRNVHMRKKGLQKVKKAMLSALMKIRDGNNWGDSYSSNEEVYPGGGNATQPSIKHVTS